MMVNEDQHRENCTKIRGTSNVPGDSSCSQWVEQSAREDVNPHGSRGRAARSRKLTEKVLAYKKETLRERRRKINGRLIRSTAPLRTYFFPVRT